jgi:hypothetical protein
LSPQAIIVSDWANFLIFSSSFGSFGQAVSEENISLDIDQSETRIAYGGHICKGIWTK